VLFDYHGIPVYIRLGLSTETPESARYMGPKGYIQATGTGIEYVPQEGIDTEPSYYDSSFPQKMRAEYVREWHEKHDPPIDKAPLTERTIYTGDDWDDLRPHIYTFFEAVKSRKPNVEDAVFGNHAAIACHMANQSYFRKEQVFFNEATHSLKS
jgi:hypothetical protein